MLGSYLSDTGDLKTSQVRLSPCRQPGLLTLAFAVYLSIDCVSVHPSCGEPDCIRCWRYDLLQPWISGLAIRYNPCNALPVFMNNIVMNILVTWDDQLLTRALSTWPHFGIRWDMGPSTGCSVRSKCITRLMEYTLHYESLRPVPIGDWTWPRRYSWAKINAPGYALVLRFITRSQQSLQAQS